MMGGSAGGVKRGRAARLFVAPCRTGAGHYLFGNVTGAVRLEDRSVVVADQSIFEIWMFDARGRHVWSSGRRGEGPGEYEGLLLIRGCPGAAVTAYDGQLDLITVGSDPGRGYQVPVGDVADPGAC